MLLKKVKESLAGRVAIGELFPFTLAEIITESWEEQLKPSLFIKLLNYDNRKGIIDLIRLHNPDDQFLAKARSAFENFLHFGGMPPIYNQEFSKEDKYQWLADYQTTYLQRDLSDLVQLDRLEPFIRCQQSLALKNGQLVNFSELARLANVSAPTANRFFQYLELSYQVILLPGFFRNREKRLSKMGKLHFIDPGIRRGILKKRGAIEGHEFESAIVSEIFKQIKTMKLPVSLYHLRTFDGREIDLLIELEDGYLAIECKMTAKVTSRDFKNFKNLQDILDKPLLAGLVVSNDSLIQIVDETIPLISIPVCHLLA